MQALSTWSTIIAVLADTPHGHNRHHLFRLEQLDTLNAGKQLQEA
ncbi:hypothetical protein [Marinagarivorans algicola]